MCGAQAFLDITGFHAFRILCSPDAGIAIRLQFHAHLQRISLAPANALLLVTDLVGNAGEILDMMADFMRDDIGLRKITAGTEPGFHFAEE